MPRSVALGGAAFVPGIRPIGEEEEEREETMGEETPRARPCKEGLTPTVLVGRGGVAAGFAAVVPGAGGGALHSLLWPSI